jgi:hypothetical protein
VDPAAHGDPIAAPDIYVLDGDTIVVQGAITECNLTEPEDRFMGICLAALAIVFVFILSTP